MLILLKLFQKNFRGRNTSKLILQGHHHTDTKTRQRQHKKGKLHGKQWKQCKTLFLGGSKITADGDCSYEIKRHLLLGRKVMTNLDSILKSRDITLPTKLHPSQGYGFSNGHVWMWELDCEELMLLNCGVWEDSFESLGLQGDPTSPS